MPMTHEERRKRRRQIADAVAAGTPPAKVARDKKCSLTTVYAACMEHGVEVPNRNGSATMRVIAELQSAPPDESMASIARRLGVVRSRVHAVHTQAHRQGIAMPNRGGPRLPPRKPRRKP